MGRVTNALGWVASTPPSWFPEVATEHQIERWLRPTVAGEREECYAITEAGAGSDVDDIVATARRDGDDYVLDGEKWHVTSYNSADYAFFQAKLVGGPNAGAHAMFLVDLPSDGVERGAYTGVLPHHQPPPPDRRRSRASGCRPPTWSVPRATACASPTSGSGSSG